MLQSGHRRGHVIFIVLLGCILLLRFAQAQGGNENDESPTGSEASNTPKDPQHVSKKENSQYPLANAAYITAIVASCVIGIVGLIAAAVCWYRHTSLLIASQRVLYRATDSSVLIHNGYGHVGDDNKENSNDGANRARGLAKRTDYPAYGVTGPNPLHNESFEPPIDKNLNKNAQLFHYHQAKKKMKSMSSAASETSASSPTPDLQDVAGEPAVGDEETSDGEYTVYECSGFASTVEGPMEIHNPLFDDTPVKSNGEYSFSNTGATFKTNSVYDVNRRVSNGH